MESRDIFRSSVDKLDFLTRFGVNLERSEAQCLAWALMSNHYHFLVQVGQKPLAKLMAPVLGGFASSYNRRKNRCGYVFQNRYKSILVDGDSYLIELIRYIHLNPVAAGLVEGVSELRRYSWTGHAGMLNKHKQEWHSTNAALSHFGKTSGRARAAYIEFLRAGEISCRITDLSGGGLIRSHGGWESVAQLRKEHIACIGDERILGSSDFVESALRHDSLPEQKISRLSRAGWDIEKLAQWTCRYTGINPEQLASKARGGKLSQAKSILCYLGARELGMTMREIANFLSISQPTVSAWIKKGELLCQSNGISLELASH
jgi:REP element-mobilizing transposase RayT